MSFRRKYSSSVAMIWCIAGRSPIYSDDHSAVVMVRGLSPPQFCIVQMVLRWEQANAHCSPMLQRFVCWLWREMHVQRFWTTLGVDTFPHLAEACPFTVMAGGLMRLCDGLPIIALGCCIVDRRNGAVDEFRMWWIIPSWEYIDE